MERGRWVQLVWIAQTAYRCGARTLAVLVGVGLASEAAGAASRGEFLGVFEGNDSEDSILLDLGLEVVRLDRVESARDRSDGLDLFPLVCKDGDEPIAGTWSYAGPSAVDLIVVKAGNAYAVHRYERALREAVADSGHWDTRRLGDRELSHLTAYRVVPEPATGALLGLGIASLCGAVRARARSAGGRRRGAAVNPGCRSCGCRDVGAPTPGRRPPRPSGA